MKKINWLIYFSLYFCSSFALACSCSYTTLSERVNLSENIFIVETYEVKTIEAANSENFSGGKRRAHFKVLDTLKGSSSGMEYISSAEEPVCCICQSKVENNTQYLVFNDGGGDIYLNSCGFTQPVSDPSEIAETIRAMLLTHKPSEIFTGIYVLESQYFLNDDGTKTKVLQLRLADYSAQMSRISIEGLKLPTGKILAINLQEERSLTEAEIRVVEEMSDRHKDLKIIE